MGRAGWGVGEGAGGKLGAARGLYWGREQTEEKKIKRPDIPGEAKAGSETGPAAQNPDSVLSLKKGVVFPDPQLQLPAILFARRENRRDKEKKEARWGVWGDQNCSRPALQALVLSLGPESRVPHLPGFLWPWKIQHRLPTFPPTGQPSRAWLSCQCRANDREVRVEAPAC